jgi:tripeptidyl-peptidase I
MMRLVSCLVAALLIIADATSTVHVSRYALKDRHPVPSEWQTVKRANGSDKIRLEIGLRHGRFEELEVHLHEGKSGEICSNK